MPTASFSLSKREHEPCEEFGISMWILRHDEAGHGHCLCLPDAGGVKEKIRAAPALFYAFSASVLFLTYIRFSCLASASRVMPSS